jgi:hypothetical protein
MRNAGDQILRTTWFSPNTLLLLGVGAPLWLVGGLLWGLFMYYFLGGSPFTWLLGGVSPCGFI